MYRKPEVYGTWYSVVYTVIVIGISTLFKLSVMHVNMTYYRHHFRNMNHDHILVNGH